MQRLERVNLMENLVSLLGVYNDKNWIQAMLKLLIIVFRRHKVSEEAKRNLVEAVETSMKKTWDDNVRKLAIRFFGVAKTGPKSNLQREWMIPDVRIVEVLFKLNLPELLSKNETADKFSSINIPDTKAIEKNKVEVPYIDNSRVINGIRYIPEVSLINKAQSKTQVNGVVEIGNRSKSLVKGVQVKSEKEVKEEHKFVCYTAKTKSAIRHELKLPFINDEKKIDVRQYAGHEDLLYAKYMDIDIADKVSNDSKMVRNLLGIGGMEAGALKKATEKNTLRELIDWYSSTKDYIKLYSILLYGIMSSKRADKIMCILHLIATQKLQHKIYNPYITY